MFHRRRKSVPLNPAIGLDRETVPLAEGGPVSPVTPITGWDRKHPIDPVSVLPRDLTPYFDEIDALIASHAHNGTIDEATPDLLDRLINDRVRRWKQDVKGAVPDGLEIHDLITRQGEQHIVEFGQRIAPLRDELNIALQQRDTARTVLTGGADQQTGGHELPKSLFLPEPWLPQINNAEEKAS